MTTSNGALATFAFLGAMVLGGGSIGCGSSPDEEAMDDTSASEITGTAKCPGYESKDCTCSESLFNCELPNEQPGRNRFLTLSGDNSWGLKSGAPMYDGASNLRGYVKSSKVEINFGQRKQINGNTMVFAFGAELTTGQAASSWIPEEDLDVGKLVRMPTVTARDPHHGDYATNFAILPGVPKHLVGLKVVRNSQSVDHEAASDYFERPGHEVYILYALPGNGGVANDAFPVGTKFNRSKGVKELFINLYEPKSTKVVGRMGFVYGHVNGRFGWIAREAIDG